MKRTDSKKKTGIRKRICSILLAAEIGVGSCVTVQADDFLSFLDGWLDYSTVGDEMQNQNHPQEEKEITVSMLEGEAQPGKTTHKGFLHTRLLLMEDEGVQNKEIYLPVVVTPQQQVYVPLEIIASHLGRSVQTLSPQKMAMETEGGELVFQNLKSQIRFVPEDLTYEASYALEGTLPVSWFDDRCCVGLDDFLNAAGCSAVYGNTDDNGKEILLLVCCNVPSRMDAYREFYKNLDDRYRFLISDLGGTAGAEERRLLGNAILGYLSRFWDADMVRYTLAAPIPARAAKDYAQFFYDRTFMEEYLSRQLVWNDAMGKQLLEKGSSWASTLSEVFDAYTDGKELWQAGKTTALAKNYIASKEVRDLLKQAWETGKYKETVAGTGLSALAGLLEYICLARQYESGDDYEVEAARTFTGVWTEKGSYLSNEMMHVVFAEIEHYEKDGTGAYLDAALKYAETKGFSFSAGALAAVGVGVPGLAAVSLGWDLALGVLTGGGKERAEDYMAGYYGILYELDAIRAARQQYEKVMRMQLPSDQDLETLEYLTYNAAKACYTTRCLIMNGCGELEKQSGKSDSTEISGEIIREQKKANEEIADLMSVIRQDLGWTGFFPARRKEQMAEQRDHYPNVLFNVAELSGQVLDAVTGKPAENVGIRIFGAEEIELETDRTDKDGRFCISFDLDDGGLYEDRPDVRDLTLQMTTFDYAAVVVPVTVQSGHRYQIDGLQTGEFGRENYLYVTSADTMRGNIVLECHLAVMDQETLLLQPSGWLGTGDAICCPIGAQLYVEEKVTKVMLPHDFRLQTVYGHAFEGIEWAGLMLDEMTGTSDAETFMKKELTTAEEINTYLELYHQYNGEYPTYRMTANNSRVKKMEPVFIVRG